MNYVLTNGHTYISKKPNGKFTATYDAGLAVEFDSEEKAWNALSQLQRGYREAGYLPKKNDEPQKTKEEADTLLKIDPPMLSKDSAVSFSIEDSQWLSELKSNLKITAATLGNLKKNYANVYGELNRVSGEIEDIEHAIEFLRPNAVKKCYLESELKKARKKRRECKDAMILIEVAMKMGPDDWGSGKMEESINHLETRTYIPRVRKDLFE